MLLLASCGLALLVIGRAGLPRFEAIGTALFVLVMLCIATGAVLSQTLTQGVLADGRALFACGLGPLTALLWRDALDQPPAGAAIGVVSGALLLGGLTGHALALQAHPLAGVVVVSELVLAAVVSLVVARHTWRRAQRATGGLQRARHHTETAAAVCVVLASLSAGLELSASWGASSPWAMWVAVAVSAAVAGRTAAIPPTPRDLVIVAVAAVVGFVALPISSAVVVAAATAIAVSVTAGLSIRRVVVPSATSTTTPLPATPAAVLAVQAGTQLLTPLFDDATLRRPLRPHILSRTSVRRLCRLLESAVDAAWHAQPAARGHPPVDVTAEGDPDIDGDVGELGEALCAIVDNALTEYVRHPERRIDITVRATASTVSIDVVDGSAPALTGAWRPFLVGGPRDVDRPGFGVSLTRAQLLIERHGGELSLGRGAGAAVHVRLPRRRQRGPVGVA
jgi:hypothetical protein